MATVTSTRDLGALAHLRLRSAVDRHLARAAPAVLAVKLHPHARFLAHLANRISLHGLDDLVALLREGHLHLALGLRRRSSSPLGQPVLPPLKVSLSSVSGILDRGLLRSRLLAKKHHGRSRRRHDGIARDGVRRQGERLRADKTEDAAEHRSAARSDDLKELRKFFEARDANTGRNGGILHAP